MNTEYTEKVCQRAHAWYVEHKATSPLGGKLRQGDPALGSDILTELWKDANWKWFLNNELGLHCAILYGIGFIRTLPLPGEISVLKRHQKDIRETVKAGKNGYIASGCLIFSMAMILTAVH